VSRRFDVLIAPEAERDVEEIYRYIAEQDGIVNAAHVLAGIESACSRLAEFPHRGNVPKELSRLGIAEYRETHFQAVSDNIPCRQSDSRSLLRP
jgi:toxin ParE1/3/4